MVAQQYPDFFTWKFTSGFASWALWERVITELPIGSELANTFENKFINEQIPQNL